MLSQKEKLTCLIAVSLICLFANLVQAAPINGDLDTLQQPDGTLVSVRIWGDEYFQHVESLDGQTLVRDAVTGEICYAQVSADGEELISTGQRYNGFNKKAGKLKDKDKSNRGYKNKVRLKKQKMREIANKNKALLEPQVSVLPEAPETTVYMDDAIQPASIDGPSNPLIGNYMGLTLLIDFSDQVGTIPQSEIDNFCNQVGYSGYSNNGSVRDYFYDVSGEVMIYENHVTAYYRAIHPKSYYEDSSVSYGSRARELIREALNYLDDNLFNFSTISTSGGTIRALNALYAGNASSGWAEGLWPHKGSGLNWSSENYPVSANVYQITDIENQITLGTFCHENGHSLCGYPDLYDYGYDSKGTGVYCLMSSSGNTNPMPPNAYLRYKTGWETLIDLTSVYGVDSHTLTSNSNTSYLYANESYTDEFFIMESRQDSGRNTRLPESGMMIWHVDTNGSNNNQQMTPSSHYRVSIEQADGDFDLEFNRNSGDSDDLFHTSNGTSFDDYTTPNANWWSGDGSGLVIRNISSAGPTMTFETHNSGIIMSFETPIDNQLFIEGDDITPVIVNASDQNGSISNVRLYLDDVLVGQDNTAPYEWNDAVLQNMSAGYYTLKAVATDNDSMTLEISIVIEVLGPTVVDINATSYSYDIGAKNSVVMSGWSLLFPEMYGDINWSDSVNTADRGTDGGTNDINRDFVYKNTPVILSHKVKNGLWGVTINMGDRDYLHDNMVVAAEGLVFHADVDSDAGQYPYANFDVAVFDGELNIEMSDAGGADQNWVWTRLSLTYKSDSPSGTDLTDFSYLASAWQQTDPASTVIFFENYNDYDPGSLSGQGDWSDFLSAPSITSTAIYPGGGNAIYATDTDNTYRFAKKAISGSTVVTDSTYYISTTFTVLQATNHDDDSILLALANSDNSLPKMEFRIRPHNGSIVVTGWGGYHSPAGIFNAEIGKDYRAIVKVSPIAGSDTTVRIDAGVYEIVNGQLLDESSYSWQINNYTFNLTDGENVYSYVLSGIRSNEVQGDDLLISSSWTAIQDAVKQGTTIIRGAVGNGDFEDFSGGWVEAGGTAGVNGTAPAITRVWRSAGTDLLSGIDGWTARYRSGYVSFDSRNDAGVGPNKSFNLNGWSGAHLTSDTYAVNLAAGDQLQLTFDTAGLLMRMSVALILDHGLATETTRWLVGDATNYVDFITGGTADFQSAGLFTYTLGAGESASTVTLFFTGYREDLGGADYGMINRSSSTGCIDNIELVLNTSESLSGWPYSGRDYNHDGTIGLGDLEHILYLWLQ